ncbi:nucleotidyl transferase AbiEii/AbiGii toxin family protein [Candidatus Parcubacteria bacterium]|nr:nucleotidyl transferase AbiEii/AbiGii toxin family protein [Candidatus Parcubacteria bacterium]
MLNRQKHEIILKNILKDIYSNNLLAPALGFKGGTACYLFYNLPRFSTDLDFNLLNTDKQNEVFDKIKIIAKKYGTVDEARIKRRTIFIMLSYEKGLQKIKIEISVRDYQDDFEIKNFLGISVLTMIPENMFAHKLVAVTERKRIANRDLFDLDYFFEKNWDINERIIKLRTGKNLKKYLQYLIKFIEKEVKEKMILDGLGEVLSEKQKDWTKKNLKTNLIFKIKNYLSVI